jgi:hypothetical protein
VSIGTTVCTLPSCAAPDIVQFSSRFAELLAAERRDRFFDVFDTRAAAREWLARAASVDPR